MTSSVVVVIQGIDGQLQNLQDGGPEDVHLLLGAVGEMELGVIQLLRHFVKIRGVVADALDIADALHQHIQLPPVSLRLDVLGELDEVIVAHIRKPVDAILALVDVRRTVRVVRLELC